MSERELTYGEAVREAIAEEMRRDPRVFLIGEDVAEAGHPFKTLLGLVDEFGTDRIIDTPISEPGYAGIGVGAAMTGMRPIVDVMFGDFITLTMDQIVNQAAKVHYMSGGKLKVPIVFRTTLGATRRSAAQHSQSLHAWVSHIPGLKVALPSTPYEAKGLMKTAIRDDSPVVIFEDKMMYRSKGPVPAEDYTVPFGVADVKRAGTDITIVATSSMVQVALAAAAMLEEIGISAEVIDPRTTFPLDKQALIDSAVKTSRVIVVDEGYERYGVTAEIAAVIADGAFYHLDAPVKRIGAMDVPMPFSPVPRGSDGAEREGRRRGGQGALQESLMATSVIMPALELAQETGKVIRWLKAPGDAVAKGEPLLEIETDKVTTEIEAPASGILMHVSAQEGDVVPVGQAIAQIGAPGEAGAAAPAGSPPRAAVASPAGGDQGLAPRPEDRRAARRRPGPGEDEHRPDREGRRPGTRRGADGGGGARSCGPREPPGRSTERPTGPPSASSAASPKARRLAAERGLDIRAVRGSGPQGAVLAADVLSAPVTPALSGPAARPSDGQGVGAVWRIMAERMTTSWTTAPHFYLFREVTVGRLAAWRQQAEKQTGARITYTDLLVKLVAAALARHPAVNASWRDGAIARHAEINIGLAVAVEDGLIVPVIHRADTLGLAAIAARREDVVSRAQGGKLRPADIQGGTFTISNLGMFGVDAFNAIVNPPQAAILAVGRIADRVVALDGQPAVQPTMMLTLSCDHRALDGARAARFLGDLADLIEEPLALLV